MHELSITENILDITLQYAEKSNAKAVSDLYIVIGELASIVDDSVQFYWNIIAQDTIAEGANLHFKRISTKLKCLDCSNNYHPNKNDFSCPSCKSSRIKVLNGEEFFLDAINVQN